jgi:uncharacterized repeat protein (TIGR03843 family)
MATDASSSESGTTLDGSSSESGTTLDASDVGRILTDGSLELEGRLISASNASFYGSVSLDGVAVPCIYKPVAGERPLWDFPDGNLANREYAARLVSEAAGWHVVPPTVLRDGRFGPGMVQQWIEDASGHDLVDVIGTDEDRPGWIAVLEAEDTRGNDVLLVHADHPRLRDLAVFDAVVNNADRKGGHVLVMKASTVPTRPEELDLRGCDHGVSFHVDTKLRTVLWGWADEPLREQDVTALDRLAAALDGDLGRALGSLLTTAETDALLRRVRRLRSVGRMPVPDGSWPAIPWPAF